MKRIAWAVVVLFLFCGCSSRNSDYERMMIFRTKLQSAGECVFTADITADYGEKIYSFTLDCKSDNFGNIQFMVTAPDNIAGIGGEISQTGGKLSFEDKALAFDLLAEGCASPVSAPWIIMRALLGGYISSCTQYEDGLMVQIDDSYEEDQLTLELWTDQQIYPNRAEILWQGRRIMAVDIHNFSINDAK